VETDALTNLFDVCGLVIYLWTEVSHAYGLELPYIYRLQLSCHVLQMSYFSFNQNTENRSVSVLPESAFKTATGIIIAIIIDLRPYYNCRSKACRMYTHSFRMESGIQYMKILFRVRPSSILSRSLNKYQKLY